MGGLEGPGALSWLLVEGALAGTWSRKRAGARIEVHVEPFGKLTKAQLVGVEAEAERVGTFYGLEPKLFVR